VSDTTFYAGREEWGQKTCCSEGSMAVPARPSGKGRLFKTKINVNYVWFQASTVLWMRSSLFWGVTQRRLFVVTDISWEPLCSASAVKQGTMKMGPIDGPETWVTNYQSTLRNILQERRSEPELCWKFRCYRLVNTSSRLENPPC
jgi:hypothetical protein